MNNTHRIAVTVRSHRQQEQRDADGGLDNHRQRHHHQHEPPRPRNPHAFSPRPHAQHHQQQHRQQPPEQQAQPLRFRGRKRRSSRSPVKEEPNARASAAHPPTFLKHIPQRIRQHVLQGIERRQAKMEDFRKEIRAQLVKFRGSKDRELLLPPMTKPERALVHQIARGLDLRTHSFGQESNRRTRVTKPYFNRVVGLTDTQDICLNEEQTRDIQSLFATMPLQADELEEHQRADMRMRHTQRNGTSATPTNPMVPPAAGCTPEMQRFRDRLPTAAYRDPILDAIHHNKVTIVTGGTGCGKTTQVPQFLLEEACRCREPVRIFCTQPRRLPAIAVAERVARERNERLGDTVGYHIRLEQKTSANTVLTYCTSGVLLRMLTVDDVARDITHIILDEVHEREQNTDYLLIVLRQALKKRDDLKVILMSATMEGNRETFASYFQKFAISFIDIPSRLHSVQKYLLGDVLALTGYQPKSVFFSGAGGNMFSATDYANPTPGAASAPFGQFNPQQAPHPQPPPPYHDQLHRSTTVPASLPTYPHHAAQPGALHHSGFYDSTFFLPPQPPPLTHPYAHPNPYAMPNVPTTSAAAYGQPMPPRQMHYGAQPDYAMCMGSENQPPPFFDPHYASRFQCSSQVRESLIESYLTAGGLQWLESVDPDLTVEVIKYCLGSPVEGAILVFLPGYDDIMTIRDKVRELPEVRFEPCIFTLHSQMNSQDQQKVFEPVRHGQKKVILSTNIAEASVTIDDVVFVVDCGKVKEKTYDHSTRISQLKVSWIARSNAEQRAGRAGRVRNGFCFRLYSQRDFEQMAPNQMAEMKRVAIHDVCLHAKMFAPDNMPVKRFLELAPEPPLPGAIDRSLEFLEQLGALFTVPDKCTPPLPTHLPARLGPAAHKPREPDLTELGRLVAHLPLDPQLARLLLFGLALKCLHPVLGLVAALSHRDPFILPLGEERNEALAARDKFCLTDFSDHAMLVRALTLYAQQPNAARTMQWCRQNFLSHTALKMIVGIRKQLFFELRRLHLVPADCACSEDPDLNAYSDSWPVLQAVVVAGCYPGVAFVRSGTKLRKIRTSTNAMASLHPSSTLRRQVLAQKRPVDPEIEYLVYQELSKIDEGLTLRTVTAVPPMAVALFAGPIRMSKVIVDDFELAEDDYDNVVPAAVTDPKPESAGNLDDYNAEMEQPDFGPLDRHDKEYYVELENWLGFKGQFRDLQLILRLRFKIMTYFLHFLRNPLKRIRPDHESVLSTMAKVLEIDHKKSQFADVNDLYKQRYIKKQVDYNRFDMKRSEEEAQPERRVSVFDAPSVKIEAANGRVGEHEPIPADPSPISQPEAAKDAARRPRPSKPSEVILAQLNHAQSRAREDKPRQEDQKLYRPPKAQRSTEDKPKDRVEDKSEPKANGEDKGKKAEAADRFEDDLANSKNQKRRIRKRKTFLGTGKTVDSTAPIEPDKSGKTASRASDSNGVTARASSFFRIVGITPADRSAAVRDQLADADRPADDNPNNTNSASGGKPKRREQASKYVIPAFRKHHDDGSETTGDKPNAAMSSQDVRAQRQTVAQRLEEQQNGRPHRHDQERPSGTARVFRSKHFHRQ